ncbi:hypothetical protein HDV00_002488 [Rhizophlyctis rosea]|nr:hypothetical protein HDV00_002488 [Rhizophlyctis rosea]
MADTKEKEKDANLRQRKGEKKQETEKVKAVTEVPAPVAIVPLEESAKTKPKVTPAQAAQLAQLKLKQREWAYNISLVVVTILSFLTRVYRINEPAQVVFDEVHFGKFASYYLRRTYYFDVHPPLGKLLLAATGWLVGYDGHFLFDKIGDDYIENNVPYVALRMTPATAGALIIPVVFLTLKEMGMSVAGATFAALLLVFDNALIAQSRLILLDSMLTFFAILSVYTWVKFYKQRHVPFTFKWWFWLSMTGVSLALTTGVKMVGLFTVACVGIAVLFDLWELLDIRRGLTMRQVGRHFAARALCLIFLPIGIYLSFFYIHFAILSYSGPGDAFHTPAFQAELKGSSMNIGTPAIPYHANITFKNRDLKVYLHSHGEHYPLRYDDGRISSEGQQVTGYPHRDANNFWELLPAEPEFAGESAEYELDEEEQLKGIRYLKHGDQVRLRHPRTDSYLITHDVASPLTPTHMEMTTVKLDVANKRYNETLWKVLLTEEDDDAEGVKVRARRGHLKLVNAQHNVAVHTHKGVLPAWGFAQNEINGNKNTKEPKNIWFVDEVQHPRIVNGTEVGEEDESKKKKQPEKKLSFLQKFFELQSVMISANAGLVKPHPYSSTPITWPFVLRGISFWETKEGLRQIYLLGNPIIWWPAIVGTFMYVAMWVLDRIFLRRGVDDFRPPVRRWWDRSIGFVFLAWALHWLPFFLFERKLFLHHYLPSFIFSVMTAALVFEFIGRVALHDAAKVALQTPITVWMKSQGGPVYNAVLVAFLACAVGSFWYFSPLTYGTGFPDVEAIRAHKWLTSWDLQHA